MGELEISLELYIFKIYPKSKITHYTHSLENSIFKATPQ